MIVENRGLSPIVHPDCSRKGTPIGPYDMQIKIIGDRK